MKNPVLQSESFERSAHNLEVAMDRFMRDGNFDESVRIFQRSVDKLVQAMGMQAENQLREHRGERLAYDDSAFASL